jgi:hypothetical protein
MKRKRQKIKRHTGKLLFKKIKGKKEMSELTETDKAQLAAYLDTDGCISPKKIETVPILALFSLSPVLQY